MRLTIYLLIFGTMAVQASGYAQKVNLSVRNAGIENVCLDIKKQTGYFFLYDAEVLKKSGKVSLELKNAELREALRQLTSGKALDYKIIDQTVIISEAKTNINATQEEILIKGTVKSKERPGETDLNLPGVIVTIKGSKKAVATMGNGTYSIQAPANGTLIFSMVGYGTKEIAINGNKTIDVVMSETASELNEVIITGYGTSETKEKQVGSAFQVTRKELDRKPLDRIDKLLEGIVPGLTVAVQGGTTSSARPRYETRIRGEASMSASNEPLWIVDGIPINTGDETNLIPGVNTTVSPLSYLNPNDIESVTVLKDATATSIYGANGANGVILITTKKGMAGSDRINYSFRTGLNLLNSNRFHVLSASEYRELVAESFANSTLTENPVTDPGTSTDWYDTYFRNGVTTQHDISLRGGNNKTRYYISAAYFNDKSIMIKNTTDRYSLRMNFDQNVSKSVDLFFRIGSSYNINNMFNPADSYYNNTPLQSPYDQNGNYILAAYNKLIDANLNDDRQKTMSLTGSAGGTIHILPELSFTSTNGIDYFSVNENLYASMYGFSQRNEGKASKAQTTNFDWNTQQRLNFTKKIGEKHDLFALIGAEAGRKDRRSLSSSGRIFAHDNIREVTYAAIKSGESSAEEETALSYYGQFKYSFSDKYHLISSFRGDANSDFGSDVRWATFKSIGASWTISNEKFWKIKQIDFAKLKLSYGTNGNSRIGASRSKGVYGLETDNNYNGQPGAVMDSGENPLLSWETSYVLNSGISIGLFKRISLELEYYSRKTKNTLDQVDVSRTTGFERIYQNVGSIRNRGIEITLNTKNITNKDFEWTTSFNLSSNKNTVLELYNGTDRAATTTIQRVGYDLNSIYLVRWAGVDPRDGSAMWYDARGNITKEYNVANRVVGGSTTPDFNGGMTNYFSYKNLSLNALLIYTVGGYAYNELRRDAESDGRNLATENQSRNQLDRWREAGDLALAPKPILGENANTGRHSTRFLEKKTSLRLQNVSLNYNLPKSLINPIKLNNASVYLQADNVGFWTPYKTKKNYNDYKNSFSPYPQPLVLSFGINVGI